MAPDSSGSASGRAADALSRGPHTTATADRAPREDLDALRRHAAFVRASPDPAIGLTLDGVVIDWNPAAEHLYGHSAEEALGSPMQMLVPPELHEVTAALLARVHAGEAVSQVDTQRVAKDGRRIDVSISMAPVRDEHGVIVGVAGFSRDITLRVLVEQRLRTSEAQLAEAQEIAGLGSFEYDVIENTATWSAELYRVMGVDPETFVPNFESFHGCVHPDDRPELQALVVGVFENGGSLRHTHRVVRPDGVERVTQICFRSATDAGGRAVKLIGTVQDVTEMQHARRELDRVGRYNEALLNSAGDGICGLSVDGTVTFANPAALRASGHHIDDLRGCDLHSTVQHSRADGSPYDARDSPILASLRDGAVHRCDRDVFWRADGTCFPVEYTSTPLLEHGTIAGAVVVFKDISERREVERVKDELTSVVSHELRTPLASIRGSLGLLESGALRASPEKAQRMIEIAVQNTDRVVRLIEDILDVDHLSSGSATLSEGSCDAAQLVQHAAAGLAPIADAANVTLVTRTQPLTVLADAGRINQTLTKLIDNAIKFSEPGMIVTVGVQPRHGDVLFQVSDEGPGVPPHKIETIFGRFEQADASDSRQKGGSGLGLTICRAIVELHGGRIWAESPPGSGATFCFTLPAPRVPQCDPLRPGAGASP